MSLAMTGTREGAGGGDGKHARAAAHIEDAARPLTAQQAVERLKAATGGAVMAGAEGGAGIDLDGDVACRAAMAVMRAVEEEATGAHRRQALQRAAHPVDVGKRGDGDVGRRKARFGQQGFQRLHVGLVGVPGFGDPQIARLVGLHRAGGSGFGRECGLQQVAKALGLRLRKRP